MRNVSRLAVVAATAVFLLLGAGACGPLPSQPPAGKDWFGNDTADTCPAPLGSVQIPPAAAKPLKLPLVITIQLIAARRYRETPDGPGLCDFNYVVHSDIHLYAQANGQNVFLSPTGGTLPWDGYLQKTPWMTTLILNVDPTDPTPILLDLDFSAKHVPSAQDTDVPYANIAYGCRVTVRGDLVANDRPMRMISGQFSHCQLNAFPLWP